MGITSSSLAVYDQVPPCEDVKPPETTTVEAMPWSIKTRGDRVHVKVRYLKDGKDEFYLSRNHPDFARLYNRGLKLHTARKFELSSSGNDIQNIYTTTIHQYTEAIVLSAILDISKEHLRDWIELLFAGEPRDATRFLYDAAQPSPTIGSRYTFNYRFIFAPYCYAVFNLVEVVP